MSKKIQIICTKPGMRRNGIEHPQSASYEPDRWSDDELAAFRSDPSFIVQEIDGDSAVSRGPEFDAAVDAEVKRLTAQMHDEMRASFNQAVKDAAAEKTKERMEQVQAEHKTSIAALEATVAELTSKLDAAVKPAAKAK